MVVVIVETGLPHRHHLRQFEKFLNPSKSLLRVVGMHASGRVNTDMLSGDRCHLL